MRTWIAWLVALTWSAAIAATPVLPTDADVFLTVERGTIVGVGSVADGGALEMRILQGFSGPARLMLVARGEVAVFDVVVLGPDASRPEGDLLLADGTSLFAAWRTEGVGVQLVWSEAPAVGARPPGILGSSASEKGLENANPRASEGGNPRSGEENPGRKP